MSRFCASRFMLLLVKPIAPNSLRLAHLQQEIGEIDPVGFNFILSYFWVPISRIYLGKPVSQSQNVARKMTFARKIRS